MMPWPTVLRRIGHIRCFRLRIAAVNLGLLHVLIRRHIGVVNGIIDLTIAKIDPSVRDVVADATVDQGEPFRAGLFLYDFKC